MKRLMICCLCMLFMQAVYADQHQLSVQGEAVVSKPADMMHLLIGVETYDQEAKKAIQANTRLMDSVRGALLKLNLSEKEVQTKSYTISPRYAPPPQNPSPDWQPSIIGYEVRNTVEIRTSKLELAGMIIDRASKAGANTIQSISFSLQNEEQAKLEAIAQAFHRAQAYAQAVVKEANVNLGEIAQIEVGHPGTNALMFKSGRAMGSSEYQTVISPRDVEVSASVSIVYRIKEDRDSKSKDRDRDG